MNNVFQLDHPLVEHHLVRLRDKNTTPEAFRGLIHRLSIHLTYDATRDLELMETEVETPMAKTTGRKLKGRIGLIPILRAGLGMVDPILDLIPSAEVWHLGFYRDEKTFQPVEYYKKLPKADPVDMALVIDPMLATGGSALAALHAVKDWGVSTTKLLAVIASPEGVEAVHTAFPDTEIHVCVIDDSLDENAYILPGLGDAGDRIFNASAE